MLKRSIILILIIFITYIGINKNIEIVEGNKDNKNSEINNILNTKLETIPLEIQETKGQFNETDKPKAVNAYREEIGIKKEIISINGKGYLKSYKNEKEKPAIQINVKLVEQQIKVTEEEKVPLKQQEEEITTDEEQDITKIKKVAIGDKNFSANEIRKQITFKDQLYGLRLAFKVNVPYLISTMREGINDETKDKVKEHLKQRLTEKEYNKVEDLVHTYIYIIE